MLEFFLLLPLEEVSVIHVYKHKAAHVTIGVLMLALLSHSSSVDVFFSYILYENILQ